MSTVIMTGGQLFRMPNILIVTITLNSNWFIFRLTDRLAGRLFVTPSKRALGAANYLLAIMMPSDYSKSLVFLICQSFSIIFWAYDPFQHKDRKNVLWSNHQTD